MFFSEINVLQSDICKSTGKERVVAVKIGSGKNLEMATTAKTNLIIILVEGKGSFYAEILPTCC